MRFEGLYAPAMVMVKEVEALQQPASLWLCSAARRLYVILSSQSSDSCRNRSAS